MRRFECTQGTSNKFWECEVVRGPDSDTEWLFKVRHGRINGRAVTEDPKAYARRSSALYREDTKIREKLRKGYIEVVVVNSSVFTPLRTGQGASVDRLDADSVGQALDQIILDSPLDSPPVRTPVELPQEPDDGIEINERFGMLEFE